MGMDRDDAYEKVLTASLARVTDFLKFAEAKNAALLAFASAWIVGIANLTSSGKTYLAGYDTAFLIALPFFVIAASFAIASLLPNLSTSPFTSDSKGQLKNLLFFGDIADITVDGFKSEVRAAYYPPDDASMSARYLDDLESQISINSKIAKRKYRLFNWGGGAVLVAVAALSVPTAGIVLNAIGRCIR